MPTPGTAGPTTPRDTGRSAAIIDRSAEGVGRDPTEILRASSLSIAEPWDAVRAAYGWMAAEGIGYLMVEWPVQGEPRVREFFETIRPTLEA